MKSVHEKSGAVLLVVIVIVGLVLSSVILAALITARTQEAVRRSQLLQRSYADVGRIRSLLGLAIAEDFEIAPAASSTPYATRLATAIPALQGSGSWGIVRQPSDAEFGRIVPFPSNPSPPALQDVSAIQDFITADVYRLMGGSNAEWSAIGEFRFRRYDFQTQDLVMQVRTVSFPLLRAPNFGPPTNQHRIAYWKPSDVRSTAADTRTPTRDDGEANRGIDEDVTLLTGHSSVPLGVLSDAADTGTLPFSLRTRAEFAIAAPGYIFSERGIRSYVAYCGVTHTYALDADLTSAPYGIPILNGVSGGGAKTANIDVAQLGHGRRVVGANNYSYDRSAILVSCESGGGTVTVSDSGGSTTPMVLVVIGSYDTAQPAISLTLTSNITRPVIFILSRVHLTASAGVTDVNGALFLDTDVDFSAADPLHVASLTYYGATASAKGLTQIVADRVIPAAIEPFAPRAVVPVAKVL